MQALPEERLLNPLREVPSSGSVSAWLKMRTEVCWPSNGTWWPPLRSHD